MLASCRQIYPSGLAIASWVRAARRSAAVVSLPQLVSNSHQPTSDGIFRGQIVMKAVQAGAIELPSNRVPLSKRLGWRLCRRRGLTFHWMVSCLAFGMLPQSGGSQCTAGHKYAYASKTMLSVDGVKADIKTCYGKLCGEPAATDQASAVAYVCLIKSNQYWGQTGYGRGRGGVGTNNVTSYRYAEVSGSQYLVKYDTFNAPINGFHGYKAELSPITNRWLFSFDGKPWNQFMDGTATPMAIRCSGPPKYVMRRTTCLDALHPCEYVSCEYRTNRVFYINAGFVNADMNSNNTIEWGIGCMSH